MIRKLISLMCISLFTLKLCLAQNYAIDLIPKNLKSRATAIVRDEQIVFELKNESNVLQTVHKSITILNEAGSKYAELTLFYDKSKSIKQIKGEVFNEFGQKISKFGNKDFKDYSANNQVSMFDDIRVKHFRPNANSYPYTIVYSYEINHNQSLFIPYWQPNAISDLAIEKSSYKFTCNPDVKLRIKEQNIQHNADIEESDKIKSYTWTVSDINAKKIEPYEPIENKEAILVKIVPESFQYFKKKGTITNWEEMGKWVYDDLLKGKQDLPEATKTHVKKITAQVESPKEKAKILYNYLQEKTRYISIQIGIGGLEPFPASYVDRLGYGDCKALVNYMQALLNTVGIESYYCVVEAGNSKIDLDESFANTVDGNHVILCLPFENDITWLECTSNKHPFGYLGNFTDDRLVLACTPDGGKILRTPTYPSESNLQIRKASLFVDKDGNVSGKVKTTFSGTQFDNHFDNMFKSPQEQNKELKSYYDIDNISFQAIDYKTENEDKPVFHENIEVAIKNYIVKNGNQLLFQPNIFNISKVIPDSKNRTNEVYINRGYMDIDEIEFTFEQKIAGQLTELEKVIESPMGKYEIRVFNEGDKIKMKRTILVNQGTYPSADYQKFHTFMKDIAAIDRVKYSLNLSNN